MSQYAIYTSSAQDNVYGAEDAPTALGVLMYSIYQSSDGDEKASSQALTRADSEALESKSLLQADRDAAAAATGADVTAAHLEYRQKALSQNNFNESFLTALALPESTSEEVLHKYQSLVALSTNFLFFAKNVGKTIISELFVADVADKLVRPVTDKLGGIAGSSLLLALARDRTSSWLIADMHACVCACAGGSKFIARGVLFKLSEDREVSTGQHLYGERRPAQGSLSISQTDS